MSTDRRGEPRRPCHRWGSGRRVGLADRRKATREPGGPRWLAEARRRQERVAAAWARLWREMWGGPA
jgi:hypothetical protein